MKKRLEAIMAHISDGIGTVDVGTDHGYLPAALALRGYRGNLIASDIRPGPLQAAKRTAAEIGVSESIRFLLCDGLELCEPDAVDTIVIAGMGGDTICRILDRAEWTMDPRYTMILQPMTKAEVLRYWLSNNEYEIVKEDLVKEAGKLYQLLIVRFGRSMALSDAELYTGAFASVRELPLAKEMLEEQIRRIAKQLSGLGLAGAEPPAGRQKILKGVLAELKEMHEDVNRKRYF